jgi:hypothetical protein
MAIRVVCPACEAAFSVSDELKGKKIRCRECEKPVTVGAQPKKAAEDDEAEERIQTKPRKSAPSRPRDDDDEDRRRPSRRGGRYDDDDEEDDEDRAPKRKAKKSSPMPWILAAVGGSVVVLGAVIGLVIYLTSDGKKEQANNTQGNPADFMKNMKGGGDGGMAGMKGGGMMGAGMMGGGPKGGMPQAGKGVIDAQEAARIDAAVLAAKELDPEVRKKIEGATVFIEVRDREKNPTSGGTGSGFLAFEPGIVLTNAHVVDMLDPGSEEPEVLKVYINHGTENQKELKGKVLGVDRKSDLAVVKVDSTGLPDPLIVRPAKDLQATSRVYVCGFPLGLAISNRVTIFQGQVASLNYENNVLSKVVMSSEMQLGNSGGPVVDDKGNVVGVNVAKILRTRINFAIPGEYVQVIVNGRLAHERIGQCYKSQARINVPITFELINPLDHVQNVDVEVWSGDDTPDYKPPSSTDAPPAPRPGDSKRERFAFSIRKDTTTGAQVANGSIMLPDLPSGKAYWWQPVLKFKDKDKDFSQWLRGEKYALKDEPADRRPIKLVHKVHPGTRKVSLKITEKLEVPTTRSEEKYITVAFTTDLIEKVLPADAQGKSVVNINVERAGKEIHIPEELLEDKKERELDAEEQRALDSASFLDLLVILTKRGDIEKASYTAKGAPADIRSHVDELGHQILDALQSVFIQLPNRTVAHLEPWKSERPIPIILPFGGASAPMKLEYSYLGVRSQNGREEGLVDMTGNFRSKGGRMVDVGGRLEGRALVDVDTGMVTTARATVSLNVHLRLRGLEAELRGKMEILLSREVTN